MKRLSALFLFGFVLFCFGCAETLYNFSIKSKRGAAGLTEKSIQVARHNIFYLEGGKGETILLIHGFGANKDNWPDLAKFLTPAYHVIALDLPGFGESSKINTESYSIDSQVKRLDKIVTTLGLNNFHIAGNSMGGMIAGQYAADVPEKVLSLALLANGGINSPEKSELEKLLEKGKNPLLIETADDFEAMLEFAFVEPPSVPGFILNYLSDQAILNRDFNDKVFNEIQNYSMEPALPKIKSKTLVIWGDTDRLLHVSSTKVLKEKLPQCTTVILKNCGHAPMMERPEETAEHYLSFLRRFK